MGEYRIFTDATADIAADMMVEMPETNVIPMNVETGITEIGPIIGAHTGSGMLAVIYWGNNR